MTRRTAAGAAELRTCPGWPLVLIGFFFEVGKEGSVSFHARGRGYKVTRCGEECMQEVRRGHTTRPGHDEPVLIFAQDVAGTNPEGSGGMTRLSESTQQRQ